jgi:ABC-2 type transport system permease protein
MRLFWEITQRSIQRYLSYRAAALAGLSTNLFWGLLRAALMIALYAQQPEVEGMTVRDAVTYTALTQAVISYLALFGWFDLMNSIYTGAVATDLLKPIGYYQLWLAQDFGRALTQFLLRGLPLVAAYSFFYPITLPDSLAQWMGFGMAMFLGLLLSFSYRFLVNLSAFWVQNAIGIGRMGFFAPLFLSGFIIPLRFMPDWFADLCWITPFPHMVTTIVDVYLGLLTGNQLILSLGYQLLWIGVLYLVCQVVLRMGIRRLVILGG